MKRDDLLLLFARTHNAEPCSLSVYLNVDQSNAENLNRRFEMRLKEMLAPVPTRGNPEKERFHLAALHIQDYVSACAPKGKGLVLFYDASDGFFWHGETNYPITNQVRWDREFFLLPLINAMDELESYGVVCVDRARSRLLVVAFGQIEEAGTREIDHRKIRHIKTAGTDQTGSSKRIQRKADNEVRAHLRNVCRETEALAETRRVRRLVLAGTPEITAELQAMLPARLAMTVMGAVDIPMNATAAEILTAVDPIARKFERETEVEKVNEIVTAAAKTGKAVVGLGRTLKAVNSNRVWELVYAGGFLSPGYECAKCSALFSTRANRCTYCGSRVQPVGNVIERAVEHTLRKHARVEVVGGTASATLMTAGGIGALLKTRTGTVEA
jgi:peptide subunit release factor 1 (eRF1)